MSDWSQRYKYTETNVETYAPQSGGVYRLIYSSGDSYYVFYVGQSDDLRRRLLEHLNPSEPNSCIKKYIKDYTCYFRYLKVSTQAERDRIEKQEIKKYSPSCND